MNGVKIKTGMIVDVYVDFKAWQLMSISKTDGRTIERKALRFLSTMDKFQTFHIGSSLWFTIDNSELQNTLKKHYLEHLFEQAVFQLES
jgi:hypothetical protein